MLTVSESLRIFLTQVRNACNADLIDRVLAHGTDLELQVNVSPVGGELVDGTTSTYTDGVERWHSFRIPKGAHADPTWSDYTLRYPLDKHADAIALQAGSGRSGNPSGLRSISTPSWDTLKA